MAAASKEIERLEIFCKQLLEAIDDFEHNIRRCADALERAGGTSPQVERRIGELRHNRDLNVRELHHARREIERLKSSSAFGV
jgi:chromosome segregation ATPase